MRVMLTESSESHWRQIRHSHPLPEENSTRHQQMDEHRLASARRLLHEKVQFSFPRTSHAGGNSVLVITLIEAENMAKVGQLDFLRLATIISEEGVARLFFSDLV